MSKKADTFLNKQSNGSALSSLRVWSGEQAAGPLSPPGDVSGVLVWEPASMVLNPVQLCVSHTGERGKSAFPRAVSCGWPNRAPPALPHPPLALGL